MQEESRQIVPAAQSRRPSAVRLAWIVALVVDAVQLGIIPLVIEGALSPVQNVLDIATAVVMTTLLGWHWAFLPTFLAELLPVFDLVPTWTLAVFLVTRRMRGHEPPAVPEPGPPRP